MFVKENPDRKKNYSKLDKINARYWKNIQNKGKVALDSFCLRQHLFVFKEFCMEFYIFKNYKCHNIDECRSKKFL